MRVTRPSGPYHSWVSVRGGRNCTPDFKLRSFCEERERETLGNGNNIKRNFELSLPPSGARFSLAMIKAFSEAFPPPQRLGVARPGTRFGPQSLRGKRGRRHFVESEESGGLSRELAQGPLAAQSQPILPCPS